MVWTRFTESRQSAGSQHARELLNHRRLIWHVVKGIQHKYLVHAIVIQRQAPPVENTKFTGITPRAWVELFLFLSEMLCEIQTLL